MSDDGQTCTVLIIGAGPGGLQTAYFLQKLGIDYVVLERGQGAGEFFRSFPRGRRLISLNKVNNGGVSGEKQLRWDWNSLLEDDEGEHFKKFDTDYYPAAASLVDYLADYVDRHELRVEVGTEVVRVEKGGGQFVVTTNHGEFRSRVVIVGTGTAQPYVPTIPGIELAERYADFIGAPDKYRNKRVLIIGKGNSAFETANTLLPLAHTIDLVSPSLLREAARTHFAGDLRSINSTFLDTFFFKQQNTIINGTVLSIRKRDEVFDVDVAYSEDDDADTFEYDTIISCAGFRFDTGPFAADARPSIDPETGLPNLTSEWESVNVPGMFFTGALMQGNDCRGSGSSFIKGLRYNARTLAHLIAERGGSVSQPETTIEANADAFVADVFARVHASASLWHLWGCLCDVYVFDETRRCFRVLRDVPQRNIEEKSVFGSGLGFVLQFTHSIPLDPEARKFFAPFSFLHPVVKLYRGREQLREAHVLEDIKTEWREIDRWKTPVLGIFSALTEYSSKAVAAAE